MNLVLVESPAKAKTIEKYLGKSYKVKATVGHIIDLPKSTLAVDVEHDYKPEFKTIEGKDELIKKLKKEIPKDGEVFLAMDPDREGEAIAWHTQQALNLKNAKRITFHEITKTAVEEAIKSPRKIDQDLVDAQFGRRILDRLVGYKLSQLLWKKIWFGLSAGRVQSVALRLIVEREEEIQAFIPEEFWDIDANLKKDKGNPFLASLTRIDGKKFQAQNENQANEIKEDIGKNDFKVVDITEKEVKKHAFPPFTTSTLQQTAIRVFGLTAKRTMSLAQALYQSGYITYMRTDSTNLSSQAIEQIRGYVGKKLGADYLPSKPNFYKTKSKNAQEAHEAIRPTDVNMTYEALASKIDPTQAKLYGLIWRRTVASQMSEKRSKAISAQIEPLNTKKKYTFILSGEEILFDGFRKILKGDKEDEDVAVLEGLSKDDILSLIELSLLQKFTKSKARYTEATLVKALETMGIGRPSTYATIISTIIDRSYVEKLQKQLLPTEVGKVVCNFLKKNFERLLDYKYTAEVENDLDEIANGKVKYSPFLDAQYKPLVKELELADKNVKKEDVVILGNSDVTCPECKGKMVERLGRNGKFLSCAKFPECKGILSLTGPEVLDEEKYMGGEKCDKCGANMILKSGKFGKFWACEKYPECKNAKPLLLKEICPECGNHLIEKKGKWKRTFIGCSGYPNCKYIKKVSKKKED